MDISNDYLIYNELCTVRLFPSKVKLQDRLISNRYLSLDLSTKNQLSKCHHKASILSLDIECGENRYLLAGGSDRLSLFDLINAQNKKECIINESKWLNGKGKIHKYGVTSIKWYPFDSGMFVSGSLDGNVIIWDTNTFNKVLKFNIKQKIFNISINKANKSNKPLIAVASNQYNIYLCDILSNSFTHSLIGHSNIVRCVSFNPFNEYQIASGSYDGCIRIWDIRKAGCLLILDETNLNNIQMHKEYFNTNDELRINKKNLYIQSHHNSIVCHLNWSNNYKFHLFSSGTDKKIRKWRIDIQNETKTNPHHQNKRMGHNAENTLINFRPIFNENLCQKFVISENDKYLFYPNNCDISMFSTIDGTELNKFKGHFSCIYSLTERKKYQEIISGDIHGNILIFSPRTNTEKEIHEIECGYKHEPILFNVDQFCNDIDQDHWSD